jgi:NDP-sugar pyrophosphorylase family protein
MNHAQLKCKVVIPCGGRGRRLDPLTESTPKPLLKVFGRPVVSYALDGLLAQGYGDITLSLGYGSDIIERYLAEQVKYLGLNCFRPNTQGTCGFLVDSDYVTEDKATLVVYSDVLVLPDVSELVEFHFRNCLDLTLTAQPATLKTDGSFRLLDDLSSGRPVGREESAGSYWTYAPFAVISPSLIKDVRRRTAANSPASFDLIEDLVMNFAVGSRMHILGLDAPVIDIGEGAFAKGLLAARYAPG